MSERLEIQEQWAAVDRYIADLLVPSDAVLDSVLKESSRAGLPPYNVSPCQGKFLMLMAQAVRASRILEIGTLGGYSTIWLARSLPANGQLVTLEVDPKHAEVARRNFVQAGLNDVIQLRVGPALDTLPKILEDRCGPFDLIFIDADKQNNASYFAWAMKLSRPGSMIIVDNVIRDGAVVNSGSADPSVLGVRRLNELIASEKRVEATAIQTVGIKGYDGFAIAMVKGKAERHEPKEQEGC